MKRDPAFRTPGTVWADRAVGLFLAFTVLYLTAHIIAAALR